MLLAMAGVIASHLGAKLRDVETRIESCDFPKSGSGKYLSIRKQLGELSERQSESFALARGIHAHGLFDLRFHVPDTKLLVVSIKASEPRWICVSVSPDLHFELVGADPLFRLNVNVMILEQTALLS
jgi:hypothetical protein